MLLAALPACGSGEQSAELSGPVAPAVQAASTTTTTAAAPSQPALSTSTTTARTGAPASSTTAPRAGPTTTAAPAPLRPAAAGTYRYDTQGQSTLGTNVTPYPALTTLVIDPASGCVPERNGCNRQRGVRDLRDPSRNGPVFESTFEYRPDGLYLVNLRASATLLLFTVVEDLLPASPVLLLPTGAGQGYHREVDIPTQTSTAHLVIDVVRPERVTVAGQAVGTTVVHLVATLPGQYNARLDLTVWLAPSNGLWVRERVVADASAAGIPYRSEYDATLQRLTPA